MFQSDLSGLSPRKASLRNNRQYVDNRDRGSEGEHPSAQVTIKETNIDFENSKRKRRESHDTSGSDKDESKSQLPSGSRIILSPKLTVMDLKKCKFETERERMFRVSPSLETEEGWKFSYSLNFDTFQLYQPWVLQTYGDSSKTKTITTKKQNRIIRALCGMEYNNPDSSKFRYWVKVKG